MKTFKITNNGFIKTYINGILNSTLFDNKLQRDGLMSDGFIQIIIKGLDYD